MAQYGRFEFIVQDADGNALPNISIEVRTQGALVTSTQAGPGYTVNDSGGIATTNQVRPNALTGPTRQVTAVTATTVTTGGAGLGTLNNNDRITVQSPLPTLYADGQGAETKSNPLTTDASGRATCWAPIVPYDVIYSGTGYTTRLEMDKVPGGVEYAQSNIFQGASAIAFRRGTVRTLASGKLWVLENPIGVTEKASIDYAGNLTLAGNLSAVNGTFSGTLGVTGNTTLSGTLAVTGTSTFTGAATFSGGASVASSFTYSGAAGSLSLTAGSIETADLATNCVVVTRTADGTADQSTTAAAYAAGNYDGSSGKGFDITGASITFTPASSSSEIEVIGYCPGRAAGAGALDAWFAIRDGSGNVLAQSEGSIAASAKEAGSTLIYRVTGLTGSQTFKLSAQSVTNSLSVLNSTWLTGQKSRIIVKEFKK